jgi:protein TonB
VLDCVVGADGRIGCSVTSEDPSGWGFGEAAIRISRHFRMSPRLVDGSPTEGGRVRVPINFRLE